MKGKLHIKRLGTNEIVHSVEVTAITRRTVEKVLRGILRNLDTDNYCVDDSEFDELLGQDEGRADVEYLI